MSAYVKQLDANHMVTIGSEGFWGTATPLEKKNPAAWAAQTGQNFTVNHALPTSTLPPFMFGPTTGKGGSAAHYLPKAHNTFSHQYHLPACA